MAFFLCRALVAAGFMPDLASLRDGRFEVVLCSEHGFRTAALDAAGQPVTPDGKTDSGKAKAGDCPFGPALAKSLIAPPLVVALRTPATASPPPLPASPAALLPPAQGPPLGPRAPPSRLV